jgi:hypothetical protein
LSRLTDLTKKLAQLRGVNKPALSILNHGAAEEQQLAQYVDKLAKEAELAKVAQSAEPLTHNPFESTLKDFKPAAKEIVLEKPFGEGSLGDVVSNPQTPQFESHLGDVVPDAPNPPSIDRKQLHNSIPEFNEPTVEPKASTALDLDQDAAGLNGPAPKDEGFWKSIKDRFMENKGKVAAGAAGVAGAGMLYGGGSPSSAKAAKPSTEVTANQPTPKEVAEPQTEE